MIQVEEGEDDDEVNNFFKMGKKKKKVERNFAEIVFLVENVMVEFEVIVEEDVEFNRQGKFVINKFKKFFFFINVFGK